MPGELEQDGQDLLVTETDPVIFFFFETGLYVTGVTLELTKQPRITND